MRQIKFRGQCTDTKEWVYGYLFSFCGIRHYYSSVDGDDFDDHEVIPSTVGQFTGLLDKNGKEIYDGDVCQIMLRKKYGHQKDNEPATVGAVSFGKVTVNDNTLYTYNAFHINGRSIEYLIGQELEIIGNIHTQQTTKP